MDYRQFGRSGLKVPVLSFGTATFGGSNEAFRRWGKTDVAEATRLIDICLDGGVNFFDTTDVYSQGAAETILGAARRCVGQRTSSGRAAPWCNYHSSATSHRTEDWHIIE